MGGEFFAGSIAGGLARVGHLRSARLPGGDASARYPVQAAAGFPAELGPEIPRDMTGAPFYFPERFLRACELVAKDVRCFGTTSGGRLFDTVAALLGFTREITYEGQAAIWLEQLARTAATVARAEEHDTRTTVLSGGVFQNNLLLSNVLRELAPSRMQAWTNTRVPPNDGGLSLGHAALAI